MSKNTQPLRRGAAGVTAILLAGASMWLGAATTMAQGPSGHSSQGTHSGPGDSNRGDVWTDNVGQPAGPGHEQDPHLACADINLWGADMGDSGGSYAIDSWPPSGNQAVVYNSTWKYNQAQGGTQVMDVINVQKLVAAAQAAGATPVNKQGYHFKLDLSQDPQKHKTFWVNCPPPSAPRGTTGGTSAASGGTGSGAGGKTASGGTAGAGIGAGNAPGVSAPGGTPAGRGLGAGAPAEQHAATGVQAASTTAASGNSGGGRGAASGVLGAATTMPSTGTRVLATLAAAMVLTLGGLLALRRARPRLG